MATVSKREFAIPVGDLEDVDELFYRQVQMGPDKVQEKFAPLFSRTRKEVFATFAVSGLFEGFRIMHKQDDELLLDGGGAFCSPMLASVLAAADELVLFVVTVEGYEELDQRSAGSVLKQLFYDAWGTAFVERASQWAKRTVRDELAEQGLYCSAAWSPGQHNVDLSLQRELFALVRPERIGVTLNGRCLMHPKKSVSGIIGVGPSEVLETLEPCDYCERRATCPSAYASTIN